MIQHRRTLHTCSSRCFTRSRARAVPYPFCGRGNKGLQRDRVATYEGAIQRDIEIAKNFLAKRQTPFWQFSYDMLCGVLERCKGASSNLHDLIGWSNLVKIGDIKGNPTQEFLKKQAGLCIEQLRVEIAALRPDAIVLPTSNCAEEEILYPCSTGTVGIGTTPTTIGSRSSETQKQARSLSGLIIRRAWGHRAIGQRPPA